MRGLLVLRDVAVCPPKRASFKNYSFILKLFIEPAIIPNQTYQFLTHVSKLRFTNEIQKLVVALLVSLPFLNSFHEDYTRCITAV